MAAACAQDAEKGPALNALAPAVLERSPPWQAGNLLQYPPRLGRDEARQELVVLRGHARHLEDHVAALQHSRVRPSFTQHEGVPGAEVSPRSRHLRARLVLALPPYLHPAFPELLHLFALAVAEEAPLAEEGVGPSSA